MRTILVEFDRQQQFHPIALGETTIGNLLNYEAGIWSGHVTPGDVVVTDDHGNTGYFVYKNTMKYIVKSAYVDNVDQIRTASMAELRITNAAYYYDTNAAKIYFHLDGSNPPLGKKISVGRVLGYVMGAGAEGQYFDDYYFSPSIKKIFPIKKSIDPLFYGLLRHQSAKINFLNHDGDFDEWRNGNMSAQPARILTGEHDAAYSTYKTVYTAYIEDDNRDYENFSVKLNDPRKNLTQPVCERKFTLAEYPGMEPGNIDVFKRICYGEIYNAPSLCLTETQTPTNHTFFISDTYYNSIVSLNAVYIPGTVEGTRQNITEYVVSVNLAAGTFTIPASRVIDNLGNVTIDFTASSIKNGVEIIKNLMLNHAGRSYISTLWDMIEVNAASSVARNTSVYVDDEKKLADVLRDVCIDIDARFFYHDDGRLTVRLYDENRIPKKTIYSDEWLDEPDVANDPNPYLSSVTIKYQKNQSDGNFLTYENVNYKPQAFDTYKKYKTAEIETNLVTETDAIAKSESVMRLAHNVTDIVTRACVHDDFEICDFLIASPHTRESETERWGVYEVVGVEKDFEKNEHKYSMRYVKPYTMIQYEYILLTDENGNNITDEYENGIVNIQ